MPTYKNVNKTRKSLLNKTIEPEQEVCSLNYYNENEVELLKVNDKPYFNPTIFSGEITEEQELLIPEYDSLKNWLNKYNIHFYVEEGVVEINYNSKENKPSLFLYQNSRWNQRCLERTINKIIISSKGKFKLYIIIEKI